MDVESPASPGCDSPASPLSAFKPAAVAPGSFPDEPDPVEEEGVVADDLLTSRVVGRI
ncbi:hypothetical protein KIN20_021238 [Parelaphostrongylus tenuis]|uniref:Uncharacterized protein n=1 Tax=Parelaphostrongylus tenuis TaxID=148309 RepID=A0AAD5QW18_PARTN|nr:hypothetical protein KIN20_021238 [Parelaphostrongylus tenuis]